MEYNDVLYIIFGLVALVISIMSYASKAKGMDSAEKMQLHESLARIEENVKELRNDVYDMKRDLRSCTEQLNNHEARIIALEMHIGSSNAQVTGQQKIDLQ